MLPLNVMVLVFAIIAIVKLRQSVEAAMLDVLLPVLLLVPAIYSLRIPHLPAISCYDAVLIPLGFTALVSRSYNWRFQRADLWVLGFALAGFYSDYINLGLITALDVFPPQFLGGLLAYVIGKLLIEQTGYRELFTRRLVILLAAVGAISIVEFVGRHDLFVTLTYRFFSNADYWGDQIRYGFLRVKGPFQGAEEAGIVFLIGFFLSFWLWFLNKSRNNVDDPKHLGLHRSAWWVGGILLGLTMTLSRGPLLGAAAGYLVARVGSLKRKRLALTAALVLLTAGGAVATVQFARLAKEAESTTSTNESQASAAYRTQLYEVYKPIAEKGGAFGWSASGYKRTFAEFPKAGRFFSIDNEYLLLWVIQGTVGLTLFLLIFAEGAVRVGIALLRSQRTTDTCFYYCLGGMLIGLLVVLITVFLAGQGYILFFLISGWLQSLPDGKQRSTSRFTFRRVFAS